MDRNHGHVTLEAQLPFGRLEKVPFDLSASHIPHMFLPQGRMVLWHSSPHPGRDRADTAAVKSVAVTLVFLK